MFVLFVKTNALNVLMFALNVLTFALFVLTLETFAQMFQSFGLRFPSKAEATTAGLRARGCEKRSTEGIEHGRVRENCAQTFAVSSHERLVQVFW